ncbi:MAG: hypothetical protein RMM06_03655 [Armatimonadota bacterium]|nr:hypothetical protein [bacterium]MDW8289791.1 hypothetical protein [Armatimonadota bacterium]
MERLFHPVLFYLQKASEVGIQIQDINACYVLRQSQRVRGQAYPAMRVRLYLYRFDDPSSIDSIRLLRKAEYHLHRR